MAQVDVHRNPSRAAHPESRPDSSKPMSRLEQMQANLHRKLLQEKEDKMGEIYNNNHVKANVSAGQRGPGGGNVRRFFEERRAMNLDGSFNLDNSMTSLDSYFLNASNGVIARNNFNNNTIQRPKKGSPIGWDKSYPLIPIERTNSGSSSGYESVGAQNKAHSTGTEPRRRVSHLRRQSLDRQTTGDVGGNMRRSKSQTIDGNGAREDSSSGRPSAKSSPARGRPTGTKENRALRDEEKRKLQQEMRRREQELINKIKEQQAEIERMRQEKIKEEKAQKARLYRKPAPLPQRPVPSEKTNPTASEALGTSEIDSGRLPKPPPESKKEAAIKQKSVRQPPPPKTLPPAQPSKPKPPPRVSSANSDFPECTICGRRFAPDRIEKHLTICKKVGAKKRKTFDAVKMRTEGSEQESYLRKGKPITDVKPKKSNWRQKHENFLATIRQAKVMQEHVAAGGKLSDLPPPPPMDTSDYLLCPHCNRKFSEAAAERHIPKCQNIRSNKK